MNKYAPKDIRGHFSSLWTQTNGMIVPTTMTTRRKSYAKQKEAAKRAELLADIEQLTGKPQSGISRKIDGINRRWTGVKSNQADN